MKKKIITLCLVIALLSVAVIGGTLAYFTDVDQATNEFTVGNVSIDLYEDVAHHDAVGNVKAPLEENRGEDTDEYEYYKYEAVMPGDKMTKVVTVENDGTEGAYVALSVVQNNYGLNGMKAEDTWFNQRIDNYYESSAKEAKLAEIQKIFPEAPGYEYTPDQMQDLTDRIFTGTGWGRLAYSKTSKGVAGGVTPVSDVRYYPTAIAGVDQKGAASYVGGEEIKLIAIDYNVQVGNGHSENMMEEKYYNECAAGSRIWVYYLYLPAGASIDFDFTVSVPVEIDQYSIEAFQNMILDVRAAAIQASGFATAKDAFVALENVYSFGYEPVEAPAEENP